MSGTRLPSSKIGIIAAVLLGGACIVRVPVPMGQLRPLFQLLLEVAAIMMFAVFIFTRINRWIGVFLMLCLFSSIYPVFDKTSYMARNAVVYGLLWFTLLVTMMDKGGVKYLINAIAVIALANSIFTFFQYFQVDPYRIVTIGVIRTDPIPGHAGQCTGLMSNPNELSSLLAMSFPAFLRQKWFFGIPVVITAMLMAGGSGGPASLTIGLLCYAYIRFGKVRLKHALHLSSA